MFRDPLVRKREHLPFDVERWYSDLSTVTFESKFLTLPPEVAQAFVNLYQRRYNNKDHLTVEDCRIIREFKPKLEELISSVKGPSGKVFVRLSNRSPKDGSRPDLDVKVLIEKELEKISGIADPNTRMIAICRATRQLIAVENSNQALELILSSERIFTDLLLALDCHKKEEEDEKCENSWSTQVCIRAWNDDVRDELEFRCFVYQGQLTAISQYNHYCLFDFGELTVDIIRTRISAFWNRVKHMIKAEDYIMDVALINRPSDGQEYVEDEKSPTEIVIELNPFKTTTGGCMYDWKVDDKLLKDATFVDVRLRTEKLLNLERTVEVFYGEILASNKSYVDILNLVSPPPPPEKPCLLQ